MPSQSNINKESIIIQILKDFKQAILWLCTPFIWFFNKAQNLANELSSNSREAEKKDFSDNPNTHSENIPKTIGIPTDRPTQAPAFSFSILTEDPNLRTRFNRTLTQIESFRPYAVSSSKLEIQVKNSIKMLEQVKATLAGRPLSPSIVKQVELVSNELETLIQETIAYQKSHLMNLIPQKIPPLQLLVDSLAEDPEKEKIHQQLKDSVERLKVIHQSIFLLSPEEQNVAYTSLSNHQFITQSLARIETLPSLIEHIKNVQQEAQLHQKAEQEARQEALKYHQEAKAKTQLLAEMAEFSAYKLQAFKKVDSICKKPMAPNGADITLTGNTEDIRRQLEERHEQLKIEVGHYQKALEEYNQTHEPALNRLRSAKTKPEVDTAVAELELIYQKAATFDSQNKLKLTPREKTGVGL